VVSFTRASALDLRLRVRSYCSQAGYPSVAGVRVSTLHSLALRTLRAAGLLTAYPADPLVMDSWELENIFDAEFGKTTGIGKERRKDIRLDHEAFWSTGLWGPPNYVPPDPPISASERAQFSMFHGPRTQAYSCVLPGEIVRQCVMHMSAGTLNAVELLSLEDLVVDEFQDLNPMDQEFVYLMATQGARIFVAGDDDQSVYSFRFASPAGLQELVTRYPDCGQHTLSACFRCTPNILTAAQTLIEAYPQPNRISKHNASLYESAAPPLSGIVHRWRFPSGTSEARAIAESCRDLMEAGLGAREILVLLANARTLLPALETEFQNLGVDYEAPRAEGFLDSETGRLVLAALRVVCDANDYVAHRVLLGLRPGIGIATCNSVTSAVIINNLNFRSIFYQPLPAGVFTGRSLTALGHARSLCAHLEGWQETDTVHLRLEEVATIITNIFGTDEADVWRAYAYALPEGMVLAELRDYLWADTDEQQAMLLETVLTRLGLPIPTAGVLPARVRVMTMHGAKGLSGKIVFIPGLEEDVLPGSRRQPYPGLVLEAARLLYVSITRARVACIFSYARTRLVRGQFGSQTPSRFASRLGGSFQPRASGLTSSDVHDIMGVAASL
jgi:DNA helicase II / ATP-dependent DNA helicase PcrA